MLILMDGKTRIRIEEVSGDMVVLSSMVEPIPVAKLATVPDAGDGNWRFSASDSRPRTYRRFQERETSANN
jgi:hypothetical protein